MARSFLGAMILFAAVLIVGTIVVLYTRLMGDAFVPLLLISAGIAAIAFVLDLLLGWISSE